MIAIYADRLKKRGHEVQVVSVPYPKPSWRQQIRSFRRHQEWIQAGFQPSHFDSLKFPYQVTSHAPPVTDADVPDADVVIATWWETADWVATLSRCKGAKAYFIQHHEVFEYLPVERVKATYSLPLYKITIAQWLVDLMRDTYGDSDVSLVPNSVDLDVFQVPPRKKQPVPTVGVMYSNLLWKGCDISLDAVRRATQQIPSLQLLAFGHTPPLAELPLPDRTRYTPCPKDRQIRDIYASCDAWLFGSRFEGFGLPILEAMACRTPVIAAPAGAAPELVSPGGGILVNAEDPDDMARAIAQISALSEADWQKMSETAYQTVSRYTWEDATDRFEQALQIAIDRQ